MNVVYLVCAIMLVTASLVTTYRLVAGPNSLDRLVAVDMLVALSLCGLAVWAAYSRDTTVVSAVVALALLGFIGSIAVTRYRVPDDRLTGEADS
ncbi:monovalent cation/H+ antiporter complex subunit F [Hoyosella sp. YIM 151337]|uniref:monovalent cation/H+ antiporter complex subunit F n=1 Tax=Hoyosella sp. YIM 151337 TaxID=2992742 RepID=UPI0022364B16|nr:monovalent cation/H+ antiporter complex subunit F [Hoyosella sp. YIM 151337]MCW4351806.1 monovalent cation/H+ antiporter complex subunit F [Hoyosella sp. YIM 151337]